MSQKRVIVVGAGMAGIMATRTLHEAGYDVIALEARDRIGGRTHTDHSLGLPVDLGGAWIHRVASWRERGSGVAEEPRGGVRGSDHGCRQCCDGHAPHLSLTT